MTGARRPVTRSSTGSQRRVHLAPTEPPATPPPSAPLWWSLLAGVLAGLLAVAIGLLLTIHKLQPDAFAMAMLGGGVALVAGVNAHVLFARAVGRVARALVSAEKGREP